MRFEGSVGDTARSILSGLEGAMLIARSYGNLDGFKAGATLLLGSLAG